jgi:amino acid transporter
MDDQHAEHTLHRHFGIVQATALNVSMIVGAGVFITIPLMLKVLPGPYALLGWIVAGALILADGLLWSELGAALPGSGGSTVYLQEAYGRERWGRLLSFLFIWQFLISGPLELASGLIALDTFSRSLSPDWQQFTTTWTRRLDLLKIPDLPVMVGEYRLDLLKSQTLTMTISPGRGVALALGVLILVLLYQRVTALGRWTFILAVGVVGLLVWIFLEGALHFDPRVAFDFTGEAAHPKNFAVGLGGAMSLALYSYLGYYQICYMGDEVRNPGRTIPAAILVSAVLVTVLFCAAHLAMLGTISWHEVPTSDEGLESYSLPAAFFSRVQGKWAVQLVTICLIVSCFAAAFSGMLGYSRIPYGAARRGLFFQIMGHVHPRLRLPHLSLLLVGLLTLFWIFFDLQIVIDALITTRILTQFVAQAAAVVLLRQHQPALPRPFRVWLYPLPVVLACLGWLFVYFTSGAMLILLSLGTMLAGVVAFLLWARTTGGWPFADRSVS